MKRLFGALAVAAALATPFALSVAATPAAADPVNTEVPAIGANWLFVQVADQVSIEGNKLILKGTAPQTLMFADRPERMTGETTTAGFVKIWNQGKDSFQKDPPNATLAVTGADGKPQTAVVELTDPVVNGDTLTYTFRTLSNEQPVAGTSASLFIDWWYAGPGHCWRGPYGGLHCVY